MSQSIKLVSKAKYQENGIELNIARHLSRKAKSVLSSQPLTVIENDSDILWSITKPLSFAGISKLVPLAKLDTKINAKKITGDESVYENVKTVLSQIGLHPDMTHFWAVYTFITTGNRRVYTLDTNELPINGKAEFAGFVYIDDVDFECDGGVQVWQDGRTGDKLKDAKRAIENDLQHLNGRMNNSVKVLSLRADDVLLGTTLYCQNNPNFIAKKIEELLEKHCS